MFMQESETTYNYKVVRQFAIMTIIWGIVGMAVGFLIAAQLAWPVLNFDIPWLTFSRLRPLHTNAVIFAFGGSALFATSYYIVQRTCHARLCDDRFAAFTFWGWQLVIVAAVITLPLGLTSAKEYAELEWPIDIAITIIWVIFGWNMIGTIMVRRERHMYVAIWFYIATFVTVAVLHIVNSFEIPVTLFKSYSFYAGVQDALVQWWYGHNAVAFFLTTPYLGMMYYFLPKAANRPVYSYRLSIVHFWSLIFIYIWAGPHHLLYTALPDWAQSLGTVFSIMLIAPSWGGMINGLLTLRGAWDKVREDPILKFMVVAVTAYGMATLEGPMLALTNVNVIGHFTDWLIAHVHVGALAWNGFLSFGILYWLIPRLYKTNLYSKKIANVHFWLGTLGIVFYALSMWWSGITQSLMWKEFTPLGTLQYPNFLETTLQIIPMYMIRATGGLLYFTGVILGVYNIIKTAKQGNFSANEDAEAPALAKSSLNADEKFRHRWLDKKPIQFAILSLVVISIGGIVEFIPTFLVKSNIPTIASVRPYTPLELEGRDLYIREACNSCHSQLVRPFRSETERYGEYSKAGEYVYEHPFLWGSKRTGPDLWREGKKYPNSWHYYHMENPRSMSPNSIMPNYSWLIENKLDYSTLESKITVLRKLGVPYPTNYENVAKNELENQAKEIALDLQKNGIAVDGTEEIIALIAYLQRLGTDIKLNELTDTK